MRGKGGFVLFYLIIGLLAAPWPAGAEIKLGPEQACQALRGLNLEAGPYQPQGKQYVCAAVKELSKGKLPNVLNYLVVGGKHNVQEIRLELSVDEPRRQGEAKNLLARAALLIAQKAGWKEPPDGLEEAVRRSSEGSWAQGRVTLLLVKHPVPDPPGGYKLVLTAR